MQQHCYNHCTICDEINIKILTRYECILAFTEVPFDSAWQDCANNSTCAKDCVRLYVNSNSDTTCGREGPSNRQCVDYGITHALKPGTCNRRNGHPDIDQYARLMASECGVEHTRTFQADPVICE